MSRRLACCINPSLEDQAIFDQGFLPLALDNASIKLQGSSASFRPPRVFYFPGTRHIW
jgi:hypothetical protein